MWLFIQEKEAKFPSKLEVVESIFFSSDADHFVLVRILMGSSCCLAADCLQRKETKESQLVLGISLSDQHHRALLRLSLHQLFFL